MQIEFAETASESAAIAVLVWEGRVLSESAKALDAQVGGAIGRAVAAGRFAGAKGQALTLTAPAGVSYPAVVVIGAGAPDDLDELGVEAAAAQAYNSVKLSGFDTLALAFAEITPEHAARAGLGARLASYRFDKYLTRRPEDKRPSIERLQVVTADREAAVAAYAPLSALADGVFFTRDLVAEPANVIHPESFAERCQGLKTLGLEVEVLGEAQMEALGMRTLLAVGRGSRRESQLVILRWQGAADPNAQPVAFIGKGVCFDSGGLSLKPADAMEDMKWDMGGGGAVAGLMCALAGRKAKVNAVGVIGLVENMPDGDAQRPGDIVVSMSGQTVEVLNTDAEGRLVLADCLWYCQERFKPQFMIDLATLTGAMIIALGDEIAGVFSNNDALAQSLLAASSATGESLWRMPLPASYERYIDSPIADVKNTGKGRSGGSITAALFLQRFVNGTPWAHLDIAPTAWRKDSKLGTVPDGPSGFGVRLLDQLVADNYEA